VSLDNIKIHIYFVQDYFRGEFFVPLKDIKIGGASLSNTLHKYCYLWKDNTLYIKYITIEIWLSFLSIREDLYVFTGLLLLSYAHFRWWLLNLSSLVQKCFYFVELLILSFLNLVSSAWFFFCLIFVDFSSVWFLLSINMHVNDMQGGCWERTGGEVMEEKPSVCLVSRQMDIKKQQSFIAGKRQQRD